MTPRELVSLGRSFWRAVAGRDPVTRYNARYGLVRRAVRRLGFTLYNSNLVWEDDQAFRAAWQTFPARGPEVKDRHFVLYSLARSVAGLEGDTVECGVFAGEGSHLICAATARAGRAHHVFDSFAGLSEPTGDDRPETEHSYQWRKHDLAVAQATVERNLAAHRGVVYHRVGSDRFGDVARIAACLRARGRRFLRAARDSLEFFYRGVPGGVLLLTTTGGGVHGRQARLRRARPRNGGEPSTADRTAFWSRPLYSRAPMKNAPRFLAARSVVTRARASTLPSERSHPRRGLRASAPGLLRRRLGDAHARRGALSTQASSRAPAGCRSSFRPADAHDELTGLKLATSYVYGYEWTRWGRYGWEPDGKPSDEERATFHEKALLSAEELAGKSVLDAGSGNGRYLYTAAQYAKDAIGLDLSAAVDSAFRNTRALPAAHVVQGDIMRPPIRDRVLDYVYSIGVLMITGDTERATQTLAKMIRPGGTITVHVYAAGFPLWQMNDALVRK